MKKTLEIGLAGVLALSIGSFGTYLFNKDLPAKIEIKETKKYKLDQKSKLLESRIEEFFESWKQGKYENLYEILLPSIQRDNPKDEYIDNFKKTFDVVNMTYDKPNIVAIKEKYGIVMTSITINSKETKENFKYCTKVFLVWREDNWYFLREAVCGYDFKDEIDRVIKAKENY